jgi:hypothetical protein
MNDQRSIAVVRVDLRTLQYGRPPVEIMPSGNTVYQVRVTRVLGKNLPQLLLFVGQQPTLVRGQGDAFYFAEGSELGFSLGLFKGQNVNPNGNPPLNWIEFTFVHVPGLLLETDQTDPLTHARTVSMALAVTAAAGQTPSVDLLNIFDPAVAPALTNARAWGHLKRYLITSSIDGGIAIDSQAFASVAGAASPNNEYIAKDNGTLGPPIFKLRGSVAVADPGLNVWKRFGVLAGLVQTIEMALDIPPSVTGGQFNGVTVWGPAGPGTLTVTAEWQEIEL